MDKSLSYDIIERLSSRKFWAFLVGVIAAFIYALGYIDEKGLAAIEAAVAAYNVGEGLADHGKSAPVSATAIVQPEASTTPPKPKKKRPKPKP